MKDQSGAAAQFRNRFGLRFQRTLQFHVDELKPRIGLGQHFQLRSQRSLNLPPLSARRHVPMAVTYWCVSRKR